MRWITRIAYGAGQMQKDLAAGMMNIFSILYLENCLNIQSAQVGLLLLCGQVINAICTPLIGMLSDRAVSNTRNDKSCKSNVKRSHSISRKFFRVCKQRMSLRNRKAWHLYGSVFMTISLPMLFGQAQDFAAIILWAKLLVLGCSLALLQIGWAAVQIAHLTLINYLTSDSTERVLLVSLRYVFGSAADISSFTVAYVFLQPISQNDTTNSRHQPEKVVTVDSQNNSSGWESEQKFTMKDMPFFRNITLILTAYSLLFVIAFQILVPERGNKGYELKPKSAITEENNTDTQAKSPSKFTRTTIETIPAFVTSLDELHSIASQLNEAGLSHSAIWGEPVRQKPNTVLIKSDKPEVQGEMQDDPTLQQPLKWYAWFATLRFWVGCFIFTSVRMSVTLAYVYISPLLIKYLKLDKSSIVLMPLGIYISALLTSLVQHYLAKLTGRLGNTIIGVLFTLSYCTVIYFCHPGSAHQSMIYCAAVLLGIGSSFSNVIAIVVITDMIGDTEVKTAAFVHGFASFMDKIFTGISIQLIQLAVPILNYKHVETFIVGSLVCGGGLLSLFDYFYVRNLSDEKNRPQHVAETCGDPHTDDTAKPSTSQSNNNAQPV